jgi:hypothetical protein
MNITNIFNSFAEAFAKKIDKNYFIRLQFELYGIENGIWQIEVKDGKVLLYNEEKIEPEDIFILSKDTLIKLYHNELSPINAFSNEPNEKGEMCSLIELKYKTEDKKVFLDKEVPEKYLEFLYRFHKFTDFFSKDYPTKVIVDDKYSVKAHNVNAIGLHSNYEKGIVNVFFSIKKNEVLKEPAFEFGIYVIKGKGIIKTTNERYLIEEKGYYHMMPKDTVYFENTEENILEIIYFSNK